MFHRYGVSVSVWQDDKVLEMISDDGPITL